LPADMWLRGPFGEGVVAAKVFLFLYCAGTVFPPPLVLPSYHLGANLLFSWPPSLLVSRDWARSTFFLNMSTPLAFHTQAITVFLFILCFCHHFFPYRSVTQVFFLACCFWAISPTFSTKLGCFRPFVAILSAYFGPFFLALSSHRIPRLRPTRPTISYSLNLSDLSPRTVSSFFPYDVAGLRSPFPS